LEGFEREEREKDEANEGDSRKHVGLVWVRFIIHPTATIVVFSMMRS